MPESYRPIALTSVTLKLLERLIYNRIVSEIERVLPPGQAGFRKGRSCQEQVLTLTNHIESGFQKRLKTGVVLIDLTAAYDTVWRNGLLFKLIKAVPCIRICNIISSMLRDRLFQVLLNDQKTRTRKLNNGLAQGSVLSCLLFNLYIHDLPQSRSRKFLYPDDMAYAFQHKQFSEISRILTNDMTAFVHFCKNWRLVPNLTKTVATCFHLTNQQALAELEVFFDDVKLKHEFAPVYLGVKLDRSLTYGKNTDKLKAKLGTRNNLMQKLACTTFGATAECLKITALALVYSCAEYCCSTWLNSVHAEKIDTELNKTMRIISGTVKSTPLAWLPALSNILPPPIRRQNALLKQYRKVLNNPQIPLHYDFQEPIIKRLKSRKPPIVTAIELHHDDFNPKETWNSLWLDSGTNSPLFNFDTHQHNTSEFLLPRKIWCNLNRLRTGHGNCNDMLFKWKFTNNSSCTCGEPRQTTNHLLYDCPIFKYSGEMDDFINLTSEAIDYLLKLDL